MLYKLVVSTENVVTKSRKEQIVDKLRASVVQICKDKHYNTFTEDEKRLLDFRPPPPYETLPTILYGQPIPNNKQFEIFGYGSVGRKIISKIGRTIKKVGEIRLYKEDDKPDNPFRTIKVKDYKVVDNLPFLPAMSSNSINFYTATPMILFDKKKKFNLWYALNKQLEKGEITKEKVDTILKDVITTSMKNSIKAHLKQHIKDKAYSFIDDIEIEIKEYSFAMMKYHKEQPVTPFLQMRFTSNWKLPMFLGHHTGKGYGMILLDKKQ